MADERLWKEAKKLAGKEGLSSVIGKALQQYVDSKNSQDAGFETLHFEILSAPWFDVPSEVIGFDGKKLFSGSFDLEHNPFDESDSETEQKIHTDVEVYRTRAGALITLAIPISYQPESRTAFATWEKHNSVRDLLGGDVVSCLFPPDRHELLKKVSEQLEKDAITWIE